MATNEEIANAAIVADMAHRLFDHHGGGSFYRCVPAPPEVAPGAGARGGIPTMEECWVDGSTGRVEVRMTASDGSDRSAQAAELQAQLQSEVFDHWPVAVARIFDPWDTAGLPTDWTFAVAATFARQAGMELSTGVESGEDAPSYVAGNQRLAADLAKLEMRTAQISGRYAQTFAENYVAPLGLVIECQRALVAVLEFALQAEAEVWSRAVTDVATIRSRALAALETCRPASSSDEVDWPAALTVAGAVAAAVAAFATAGSGLAITAVLASTAAGAAGDLVPDADGTVERPLGGRTPDAVLTQVEEALVGEHDSVVRLIEREEQRIGRLLSRVAGALQDPGVRRDYDLARPRLTAVPAAEILAPEQDVIVDDATIAKITALWMPSIAGDLRLAAGLLEGDDGAGWRRPYGIGLGMNGPFDEYAALRECTIDLLRNTSRELDDASVALADAARMINLVDSDVVGRYARLADRVTAENRNHG